MLYMSLSIFTQYIYRLIPTRCVKKYVFLGGLGLTALRHFTGHIALKSTYLHMGEKANEENNLSPTYVSNYLLP